MPSTCTKHAELVYRNDFIEDNTLESGYEKERKSQSDTSDEKEIAM